MKDSSKCGIELEIVIICWIGWKHCEKEVDQSLDVYSYMTLNIANLEMEYLVSL